MRLLPGSGCGHEVQFAIRDRHPDLGANLPLLLRNVVKNTVWVVPGQV
jgi:hypothetical protein